jgi:hypothetical protein
MKRDRRERLLTVTLTSELPSILLRSCSPPDVEPFRDSRCNRLAQIVLCSRCDGALTAHGTHRAYRTTSRHAR